MSKNGWLSKDEHRPDTTFPSELMQFVNLSHPSLILPQCHLRFPHPVPTTGTVQARLKHSKPPLPFARHPHLCTLALMLDTRALR